MLKYRQIDPNTKTKKNNVLNNTTNFSKNLQKVKVKVKLLSLNKKENRKMSHSLVIDEKRTEKNKNN